MYKLLFLFFLHHHTHSRKISGYESCPTPKPNVLNVHLVPHSHDDVGWLKTVDQYYYGDNSSIQQAAVQYTLDSVVSELQKDPARRFIYVETGFFWRWWNNQDESTRSTVRNLISSSQLEFISGGWVMNDEASAYYSNIIDQMSLGLRFLNNTFNIAPKVGWQIDPFGHSREQASLLAQMSFDGLFFGRLDYQDKYYRRTQQRMEFIWRGSPTNLREKGDIFTGVLYNGYNPPDNFCFDILCNDEPIHDDPRLAGYNLEARMGAFLNASRQWATPYRTNNILMTMGSDFHYMAAHTWYKNLDKIIKHVGEEVNVFYSTPSCYLHAVQQEAKKGGLSWERKLDDFFPYSSDPHAYWTGYFTSRPSLKGFIRMAGGFGEVRTTLCIGAIHGNALCAVWKTGF